MWKKCILFCGSLSISNANLRNLNVTYEQLKQVKAFFLCIYIFLE